MPENSPISPDDGALNNETPEVNSGAENIAEEISTSAENVATPEVLSEELSSNENEDNQPLNTDDAPLVEYDTSVVEILEKSEEKEEEREETVWLIIGRIFLGIVKTLVVLGVIGAIIWLVWKPGKEKNPRIKKEPKQVEVEVEKPEEKEIISRDNDVARVTPGFGMGDTASPFDQALAGYIYRDDIATIVGWNYWLEEMRLRESANVLTESIYLLREMDSYFDVPVWDQLRGMLDTGRRATYIDDMREYIADLIDRGRTHRETLVQDIQIFTSDLQYYQGIVNQSSATFVSGIDALRAGPSQEALNQNISAQQTVVALEREIDARGRIITSMDKYVAALRKNYEVLTANREVLVRDLRVVDFPGDPFGTIIDVEVYAESQ